MGEHRSTAVTCQVSQVNTKIYLKSALAGSCKPADYRQILQFRPKPTIQNKIKHSVVVALYLFYPWFLHIEAMGGLCMPTNECSKDGELLATGPVYRDRFSDISPHPRAYQGPIQHTTAQLRFIL